MLVGIVVAVFALGPTASRLLYKPHVEFTLECSDENVVVIPAHVDIGGFVPASGQSWSLTPLPGRSGTPFRLEHGSKLVFHGGLVLTQDDFAEGAVTVVTEVRRLDWLPVSQYRSFVRGQD